MALSNAEKLINLGTPPQVALEMQAMIADYIKTKTQIAALSPASTAADIVAALKA